MSSRLSDKHVAAQSWQLVKVDIPKKFDSLMRGDFAQLKFVTTGPSLVSECLWVKVKEFVVGRGEYWALLNDKPELIKDIPPDYELMFKPYHVVNFIVQDLDGLALVDLWGKRWGWYKRSDESDYPIQCSLTTPRDSRHLGILGDGCFRGNQPIRKFNKGISYKNKKEQDQRFDKAWKSISEHSQRILFVYYVISDGVPLLEEVDCQKATLLEKVAALGITVHEYFPTLRAAREEIWTALKRAE